MRLYLRGWADVFEDGLNGRTTTIDDPAQPGLNGAAALPALLQRFAPLDLVVFMLGTNDLKAQYDRDVEDIAQGIETIVQIIQRSAAGSEDGPPRALLVTPPAIPGLGGATRKTFAGAIPKSLALTSALLDVARRHGSNALDVSALVSADPTDGIHLNANGHRTLARTVTAAVWRVLRTVPG